MSETSESTQRTGGKYEDREAGERRDFVIEKGKSIFAGSALVDPTQEVCLSDLDIISRYHTVVSPANPDTPWRIVRAERSLDQGQIADPSTFGNWEEPGGPLESIKLATQAAGIIVRELKDNLKDSTDITDDWAKTTIGQVKELNPYHTQAAAALHDEGREITHLFYTNEVVADGMLKRMGVREDIRSVLPDEKVMQVPLDQSMDTTIQGLDPEAIIVRIADEFGKRNGRTNRTLQPDDFDPAMMQAWAKNYINRPFSGRPSDRWARENLDLHVANVDRYFQSLDKWVKRVSNTSLGELATKIHEELSPTLIPIEAS